MKWYITGVALAIFLGGAIYYHDAWGQWLKPLCQPPADTVCMKCHDPAPKEQCE